MRSFENAVPLRSIFDVDHLFNNMKSVYKNANVPNRKKLIAKIESVEYYLLKPFRIRHGIQHTYDGVHGAIFYQDR